MTFQARERLEDDLQKFCCSLIAPEGGDSRLDFVDALHNALKGQDWSVFAADDLCFGGQSRSFATPCEDRTTWRQAANSMARGSRRW